MRVTEITVSAGRVIPHPHESYSNLRPQLSLKAMLEDGDDAAVVVKQLQATAEQLVEDHKTALCEGIERVREMAVEEVRKLETEIIQAQERLAALKGKKVIRRVRSISAGIEDGDIPF